MSANPTNTKMTFVNCTVNLSYNIPVTPPDMNTRVCWRCRIRPLPPGAKSIICDSCKVTLGVPDHDPHSALPRQHSPKKAVICGISYQKSSYELKDSIDVANRMKKLLIEHFGFKDSDIVMLTEEETDPVNTPTKYNLLNALYRLGQGCQERDSLVFYYCGHGLPLWNYRLRKVDETLCPMDFKTEGMIFDDEINAVIVGHLPPHVTLHAIIDSCNRDSVLDLRFLYRKKENSEQYEWEDSSPGSDRALKGTSGGKAISFSSSVHVLPSADTLEQLLSKTTSAGSMTRHFIHAIEDGYGKTYGSILDDMQNAITINETDDDLKQEPLLSACGQFDVNTEPFTL